MTERKFYCSKTFNFYFEFTLNGKGITICDVADDPS